MNHTTVVVIWCVLTGALAMHIHLHGAGAWVLFLTHTMLTTAYWQKLFEHACTQAARYAVTAANAEQIAARYRAKLKAIEDRKNV